MSQKANANNIDFLCRSYPLKVCYDSFKRVVFSAIVALCSLYEMSENRAVNQTQLEGGYLSGNFETYPRKNQRTQFSWNYGNPVIFNPFSVRQFVNI